MHSPTFPGTFNACKYVISGTLKYYFPHLFIIRGTNILDLMLKLKCFMNSLMYLLLHYFCSILLIYTYLLSPITFINDIFLGFSAANVFTTASQSILVSLYAHNRQSPLSCSSVWVILLYDLTLLSTEILHSHEHVVTGNVSNILKIIWIFGNCSFLDFFKAAAAGKDLDLSCCCSQKIYKNNLWLKHHMFKLIFK